MSYQSEKVSFGYQNIDAHEKKSRISNLFTDVSKQYDLMNDILSFGTHRIWKNIFINKLVPRPNKLYLDVAGGTGDIGLRIASKIKNGQGITILDLTYDMLAEGLKRDQKHNHDIQRICGDAENLPFPDCSFDYYTISFGIRNVTYIEKTLHEAFRVLKLGGKFMCLEFSQTQTPILSKFYDLYSFKILPELGGFFANDKESYQYLAESIRRFPNQKHFLKLINKAGFTQSSYHNLSGGIAAIHSGFKTTL